MSDYDDDFESDAQTPMSSNRSNSAPNVKHVVASAAPQAAPSENRSNSSTGNYQSKKKLPAPRRSVSSTGDRSSVAATSVSSFSRKSGKNPRSAGTNVKTYGNVITKTPQEEATLRELKRQNVSLRAQLLDLNRQLDDHLLRRGHDTSMVAAIPRPGAMLPSERIGLRNEQQRRVNNELRSKLHQADQMIRVQELSNALGACTARAEELRSENRGLENVLAHQQTQLTVTSRIEGEIADARAQHLQGVKVHKDLTKEAKEHREQEMQHYNRSIKAVERLEQKIRVQDEVGAAVRTVTDLREKVEERDRMIDALKYQVAVLSKTNAGDKKRAKALCDKNSKELKGLQAEAAELRHQLAHQSMAAELGVDTRI